MVREFMGQNRTDKLLALGEANVTVLREMKRWCKHFDATQTTAGMMAQMSGLPIASFRLGCPHAKFIPEGMDLTWLSRDFLDRNCRDCPHHEPNGDDAWGRDVLLNISTARTEATRRQADLKRAVEEVRLRCRAKAGDGRKEGNAIEHQVLNWAEQVFDDDADKAGTAAIRLAESAKVAPDLFGEAVIDALCLAASTEAFHARALPVLAEVARRRKDLAKRLTDTATAAIEAGFGLEWACAILYEIKPDWTSEARKDVIERVVKLRNHIEPLGGWPTRHPDCDLVTKAPDYSQSNAFLLQEYSRDAGPVLCALKRMLASPDPNRRINACGILRGMMASDPTIGKILAPDLATSLELVESEFGESADDAAGNALAQAFRSDPDSIDKILVDHIESRPPPVQVQLIEVYTKILRSTKLFFDDETPSPDEQATAAAKVAVRRVLRFLQDNRLDVDPLHEAVEAIRTACRDFPKAVIEHKDILFGTLAQWSLRAEAPLPPPALLLPGEPAKPPGLAAMKKRSRDLRWRGTKRELSEAIAELVEAYPEQLAQTLIQSFNNLDSQAQGALKGEVVRLLGVLGEQYDLRPRVLPPLWTALMDQVSPLVRSRGIEAIGKALRYSKTPPPADVVSILVLHLNDPYNVVHQAAVQVIRVNADWLTEEQIIETLQRLAILIKAYKSEGYRELEEIADAMLAVSRRLPSARAWAVNQLLTLVPSGDSFLDGQLIERLVKGVRPTEPAARTLAPVVLGWIGNDEDGGRDHEHAEDEAFSWLHGISVEHYAEIRSSLLECARKRATNLRYALFFSSLFAMNEDYEAEQVVLTLARSQLPSGRRYEAAARNLEVLAEAARRNTARLKAGGA